MKRIKTIKTTTLHTVELSAEECDLLGRALIQFELDEQYSNGWCYGATSIVDALIEQFSLMGVHSETNN